MVVLKDLPDEQVEVLFSRGDFDSGFISSEKFTAIVFSQDWCPDFRAMLSYLTQAAEKNFPDVNCAVYVLKYNRKAYFEKFMEHKEREWDNSPIPYVRYYRNGIFSGFSNYVGEKDFFRLLFG